ncbi:DUF3052 domain-containing protein [Actinomadura sp. ATCC 31491]|uniref:DUF3052 domain-containing protein n=1 Tax=Actinomadura luzonensis TaxID=2805427 RepID=A0ABT0G3E0_9ACTN|nr:DUF3052 family protein [Actinomadura luzonensis]MCK2219113.1 DUF3052 domain-containing protein [Actinomadura luzonensis]
MKDEAADRLGVHPGTVVQTRNWPLAAGSFLDGVRAAAAARSGGEVLDESADEIADVVLLRWRAGDGDLVDALMDAAGPLAHGGRIWLVAPAPGCDGRIEPGELAECVRTAGLVQVADVDLGDGWRAAGLRL